MSVPSLRWIKSTPSVQDAEVEIAALLDDLRIGVENVADNEVCEHEEDLRDGSGERDECIALQEGVEQETEVGKHDLCGIFCRRHGADRRQNYSLLNNRSLVMS